MTMTKTWIWDFGGRRRSTCRVESFRLPRVPSPKSIDLHAEEGFVLDVIRYSLLTVDVRCRYKQNKRRSTLAVVNNMVALINANL
jgi:hypothetical protein